MAVPFHRQGDGEAVIVAADRGSRLRHDPAEEGPPRGGTVGEEIL